MVPRRTRPPARRAGARVEPRNAAREAADPGGKYMIMRARGRRSTTLVGSLGVALLLAGCGANETGGGRGGGSAASARPNVARPPPRVAARRAGGNRRGATT